MRVMDRAPEGASRNLALDAARFARLEAGTGGEWLRFWETADRAVILGAFGRLAREVRAEACAADGVPVLRRLSGGGAVLVGRGCLNYTLLLSLERRPQLRGVDASYHAILGRITSALGMPGLVVEPPGDLALEGRKAGGSAQRRGRRALLHHGTLLYDFDAAALGRYLLAPPREPAYRAGRSHAEFVANLPLPPDRIRAAMAAAWRDDDAGRAVPGAAGSNSALP